MSDLTAAVSDFLALERVAVVGVSRSPDQAANLVYRKLRESPSRQVFAVNPRAEMVEGDRCYPDVGSIPGGVQGAVIATTPAAAVSVIDDCARAGVRFVWLHRSFGPGSVSEEVVRRCRERGLRAIPGMCPMMFCEPVDVGHRCMRLVLRLTGQSPHPVAPAPTAPEPLRRAG
jgi:predicted CoA-binding protein